MNRSDITITLSCPKCYSSNYAKITPSKGQQYAMFEMDAVNNSVLLDTCLKLDLYGCLDCKHVELKCNDLRKV